MVEEGKSELWRRRAVHQVRSDAWDLFGGIVIGVIVLGFIGAGLVDRYPKWPAVAAWAVATLIGLSVATVIASARAPYKQRDGARAEVERLERTVSDLEAEVTDLQGKLRSVGHLTPEGLQQEFAAFLDAREAKQAAERAEAARQEAERARKRRALQAEEDARKEAEAAALAAAQALRAEREAPIRAIQRYWPTYLKGLRRSIPNDHNGHVLLTPDELRARVFKGQERLDPQTRALLPDPPEFSADPREQRSQLVGWISEIGPILSARMAAIRAELEDDEASQSSPEA